MVSSRMVMNKDHLLNESKTFCMFPWVQINSLPSGATGPCCISKALHTDDGYAKANDHNLMGLVNSEGMKQLRLDMLNGVKNPDCEACYFHEEHQPVNKSFRQTANEEYGRHFDEALAYTNSDGSLNDFKMRYYDFRFSNICNFKCRTCGQEFSSQWEQENIRNKVSWAKEFPKNTNTEFLQDVIDQIPNLEVAYFAGGEPLITDEHYILLEEMIKQNRTDVRLRYNTNFSNLKFKNKDLLGLWKYFKHKIDIYASIDHYGERAEYIRHGTDWGLIEQNIRALRQHDFIKMTMNTVFSIFNFFTMDQFYQYLMTNNLYTNRDLAASVYCMSTPHHLSCHSMPEDLKHIGNESLDRAIDLLRANKFPNPHINGLVQARSWALSHDTWLDKDRYGYTNKVRFRMEIERLDKIRGEKFENVFPELMPLMERTYE